jgi:predicted amidophosphoribosyltransferase
MEGGGIGRLGRAVLAAADLVLPARCAACHEPGGPLCRACLVEVRTASLLGGAPVAGLDRWGPPGMPVCWAAARFEGPLRDAVTAYKDEGRRDVVAVLADGLAMSLATALAADPVLRRQRSGDGDVLVVPVPSAGASRRRRGDDPVDALARLAVRRLVGTPGAPRPHGRARREARLVVAPALRLTRRVVDQSRLDRQARRANLAGAIAVHPAWAQAVAGRVCVLVDDVVTTGATLAEGGRALGDAGARHVVAATVASTPRWARDPGLVGARWAD